MLPPKYEFTYDDFLNSDKPYETLYTYFSIPTVMNREVIKMADRAKEVGFKHFKSLWKDYLSIKEQARKQQLSIVPNQTQFDEQLLELSCGEWEASDFGIYRKDKFGATEYACTHPIMPVERLVNIDTGEVKLKLAYKRPGRDKKWQFIIVGKDVASDPKALNKALSAVGISVNQKSSPILMEYLTEIEDKNYDAIPESKSIGRLGYIEGEGFSPYVDNLVFDGDETYKHLYHTVKEHGSETTWYETALECRKISTTARIMLAASFASPLLSIVGALPFFVHLWGVDSGTGKTVALMLAASVWGNPELGNYIQTFNGTQVGQERTASFLNHLPMCLDELQLTKNGKGQSNFDVYQLAQGVGRSRGKKTGGIEKLPTWKCCFLTTGETPITNLSSGAGAVNRVIDIECNSGNVVIKDGQRISNLLKRNYGWAGRMFVERLYKDEETLEKVRNLYQAVFDRLNDGKSTEKQNMAAAAIITADELATMWIFKDDNCLTVEEISEFLATKASVSAGARAYEWLCNWVDENQNHFYHGESEPIGSTYGMYDDTFAYINPKSFRDALDEAGFNYTATKSYLRANDLIETRNSSEYTKSKLFPDGRNTGRIWLRLPQAEYSDADFAGEIL